MNMFSLSSITDKALRCRNGDLGSFTQMGSSTQTEQLSVLGTKAALGARVCRPQTS